MTVGFEREDDEIVRYYASIEAADIWGVWGSLLLLRVPLSKAERLLKKDHGWEEETWARAMMKKDHDTIVGEMEDFFQFAVEYVLVHRGLSCSKTLHYYMAWAWLLNDMELFAYFMDQKNYPNYGAPMLYAYAQKYDELSLLPENPLDAEVFRRMSLGLQCSDLCPGHCGRGIPKEFRPRFEVLAPSKGLILPK